MILHPEAQQELRDACTLLRAAENRSWGQIRGRDSIRFQADRAKPIHVEVHSRRHQALSREDLPYGIVYAPVDDQIFVLAVMHLGREPDYWFGRLNDLPSPRDEKV